MVKLNGFDTHFSQIQSANDIQGDHNELLTELNNAISSFMQDISGQGFQDDVVGLTFSEFGRKAKENGNLGTDHGEIAPMFVFGSAINGGVSGTNPDLTEATQNNNWQLETFQFDYRDQAGNLGFLHIKDTGSMYILDGQHRMAAYRAAINPSDKEKKSLLKEFEERDEVHLMNNSSKLKTDQISVIFVSLKDRVEMRKLFTDVNSNARSISQSEKIGMAERNGYFKIIQNIIDDNLVFNHSDWVLPKGVSLQPNSLKFIPKKTLSTIVEEICSINDVMWEKIFYLKRQS